MYFQIVHKYKKWFSFTDLILHQELFAHLEMGMFDFQASKIMKFHLGQYYTLTLMPLNLKN